MESFILILLIGIVIFIYFIPSWIAWGKNNADSVIAINFFLGWTFVGWVVALAMAVSSDKPIVINQPQNKVPAPDPKLDNLIKLKTLFDTGAITEIEYNKEKERILNP